jgi:(R,R)-butanediol dehydrogenase/meso-butanediol dehydrogenase/diacetyl reductase
MRALMYRGPRKLEIVELPVAAIGAEDALLEVSHCGICGTDLHVVLEGMSRPDRVGGHEYSARVVAVGSEVDGWRAGDEVVPKPAPSCGSCHCCRAGRPSLCVARPALGSGGYDQNGAFAEYVRVRASDLLAVPDGLDLRTAALVEPLAVALHGITLSRVAPGDRVLVTGAGPIGLLTIAGLRALGVDDISVTEPSPLRRERASRLGAKGVLDPGVFEAPVMPFDTVDSAFDVALECSGNPRAMESALGQLRRMGTLVLLGTGMRRPKLDHNRILLNELVVTGAYCYDEQGMERSLALLASGVVPVDLLIEPEDVPLDGMLEAAERCAAGELAGKVLVVPR